MAQRPLLLTVALLVGCAQTSGDLSEADDAGVRGCGPVSYSGMCEGDVAVFCHDDVVQRVVCPDGCGWVDAQTGYYCGGGADPDTAPTPQDDACDGVPPAGECRDNVLVWCEGRVRAQDCDALGATCGYVAGAKRRECILADAGVPPPEPEPEPDPPPPDPPPPDAPPGDRVCYEEVFNDGADLQPALNRMRGDPVGALREALRIRWPGGIGLTETPQTFFGFLDPSNATTFFDSAATVMHENTHGFHADNGLWQQLVTYYVRSDHHVAVDIIETPARSMLRNVLPDDSTDLYARTYFTGEQGQRGFFELLEELNCYVDDLVTYAAFGDHIDVLGVSGRDGAVSFFLFLQLYLRQVRTQNEPVWRQICGQEAVRHYIDIDWRRTHFWLPIADRYPHLGINDGRVRGHLYQADNLREFELCLGFALEAGPCRDRQPFDP